MQPMCPTRPTPRRGFHGSIVGSTRQLQAAPCSAPERTVAARRDGWSSASIGSPSTSGTTDAARAVDQERTRLVLDSAVVSRSPRTHASRTGRPYVPENIVVRRVRAASCARTSSMSARASAWILRRRRAGLITLRTRRASIHDSGLHGIHARTLAADSSLRQAARSGVSGFRTTFALDRRVGLIGKLWQLSA